uniref:ribonuclease P n=1 Tax=Chenopodium quinoa TaxID=63459 RepID=A0A803N277_CHEQI
MKKKRTPETQLQYELGTCSKQNDLKKAISLYNSALTQNLRLSHHHFNSILHLCSSPESLSSPNKSFALENGFRVFEHMQSNKIPPTEATITQVARLAAAKNDPDYAFELVKSARDKGVLPRLRTYGPALLKYCENLRVEEAYGVEEHMKGNGVKLEEGELSALLRVSAEVGREGKVYEYLSKLRGVVRGVSEETAGVVEKWFQGVKAAEVGVEEWDVVKEWIDSHSVYEAIVDGANIGLYQQNFSEGGFSITQQLEAVVMELYTRNKRWPLVVLHKKRLRAFQENPSTQKLLEEWLSQGILYATPSGSNDDWYWLYAAVKMKCLLVTNDEMRDHIFELLGSSFFLQWKERHQVHYTFVKGVPNLKMPPTYSILIQESENGSWHIPIASENTDEFSRSWLCITRPSSFSNSSNLGESMHVTSKNCSNGREVSHHSSENGVSSLTGKRKERDPSPSRLH